MRRPTDSSETRPWIVHLRGRAPVLGLLGVLAVWSSYAAIDVHPRDAAGVAALLGAATDRTVAPDDFVWLASRGTWSDALWGRSIVFLASRDGSRDAYRANVTVTPSGQPLAVRFASPLRATPLGDEASMVSDGEWLGIATYHEGEPMAVAVFGAADISRPRITDLVFRRDPPLAVVSVAGEGPLAYGFSNGGLVATLGASTAVWDRDFGMIEARGEAASELRVVAAPAARGPWSWPLAAPGVSGPAVFFASSQPSAELPLAEGVAWLASDPDPQGGKPALAYRRTLSIEGRRVGLVALVGTLAEIDISLGAETPATQTGYVPDGDVDQDRLIGGLFALPTIVGARDGKRTVMPIAAGSPALFVDADGSRGIDLAGRSGDSLAMAPGLPSHGIQSLGALSIDEAGNVFVAMSPSTDVQTFRSEIQSLGMVQSVVFDATGSTLALGDKTRGFETIAGAAREPCLERCGAPSVVFRRRKDESWAVPPPGTAPWTADPKVPGLFRTSASQLGAEVAVHRMDPGRFSWALLAGDKEKKHRFRGAFTTSFGERDRDAVLTISLGIGKRRSTRGLRIEGSTGLAFGSSDGSIAVASTGALVFVPPGTDLDEFSDASELPWSVRDAELTRAARARGPLQERGDLCVKDGGVLVAEGIFDSHEATAQALLSLGCDDVVSLDRGSEHPVRLAVGDATGPSEVTRLVAFRHRPAPQAVLRR